MKKKLTVLPLLSYLIIFSLSSCGSIYSAFHHGKRPVYFVDAPADLEVTMNGQKLEMHEDVAVSTSHSMGHTTVHNNYYTPSVRIPYKHDATLEVYSPSKNKRGTFTLQSRVSGNYVIVDILLTAGLGLLVDLPTKNAKVLKPRLVDTRAALAGKPVKKWRSKHVLAHQLMTSSHRRGRF